MYDWATWLLAQIPLALIVAVGYFGRDTLASWFNAKTKHSFDAKLEALKTDLAAKGREIDALRSGPMSTRAARQAIIDKRRVEAVDQFWGALKVMQPGKAAAGILGALPFDDVAEHTKKDAKAREMFNSFGDTAKAVEVFNHQAHAAEPYLSPLAIGLMKAYSMGVAFCQIQIAILRTGIGKDAISASSTETILKALSAALPDWSTYIQKHGAAVVHHVLDEIEKRILAELQRILDGKEDDEAEVASAARMIELARDAERGLQQTKMEAETGGKLPTGGAAAIRAQRPAEKPDRAQ
ncbi:hypothetical protein HFN78_14280 [Rhizobium laguerreae]|uniref:hypothetical protein n=1 Tax=Rhizobium laguerreae TaxID=1076926 RepID=UPI001C9161BE|nr:hypothetical protein [Rhizobium laguerreae]MBY3472086.1 hypothetical protein [Rhizobium laguerreae]